MPSKSRKSLYFDMALTFYYAIVVGYSTEIYLHWGAKGERERERELSTVKRLS